MNNENTKNNVWKVGLGVGALLCLFLLVVSIKELKSIGYVGKDTPATNVITVSGKGESVSIPDIATFSFSVTETAKAVDEAQSKASIKINNALKTLKDAGVAEKDLKTISYNINPHYEYVDGLCVAGGVCRPGKSTLTGYDVSQSIQVKVRDIKKAGELFAKIGILDVQNVNGLTFSIDDIDGVKAEARSIAIENAKSKAKDLAAQLGVSLVRITNFYDQSDEPPVYPYAAENGMMMTKSAMAPAPAIPAGEQKVTSTVSITYEIK